MWLGRRFALLCGSCSWQALVDGALQAQLRDAACAWMSMQVQQPLGSLWRSAAQTR